MDCKHKLFGTFYGLELYTRDDHSHSEREVGAIVHDLLSRANEAHFYRNERPIETMWRGIKNLLKKV